MEGAKVSPGVRKTKKKQVKDELDRLKQAEKKKRRLEKALATSAAIRTELEKKKQKKKEEQQRLDQEGAAIAEAVALQVLGEDSDDSCNIMLKKDEVFSPWVCASNIDFFMGGRETVLPHQDFSEPSLEGIGWVPNIYRSGCKWPELVNTDWPVSSGSFGADFCTPYSDERVWETSEISAGLIASQAVASLQIAEDAHVDTYLFNRMLRG